MEDTDKNDWKLVTDFSVANYHCGLRAGDTVELIKDLEVRQEERLVEVIKSGEEWVVLKGSPDSPGVVWLRRPNGKLHTWDDDQELFEHFQMKSQA